MKTAKLPKAICCSLLLTMIILITGCQNHSELAAKNQQTFTESIKNSVEAIENGDLVTARIELDRARPCAAGFEDERIVQSLDDLISGAESMMKGDVDQARADWAAIQDPQLSREVRVKADVVMGLQVPVIPELREAK